MNCENVRENLLAHLYGALSDDEDRQVRTHLETCAECREALAEADGQRGLLADAATLAAGELDLSPPAPAPRRLLFRLSAAAAVLLAVIGLWAWRGSLREQVVATNPQVAMAGPATLPPGEPAEISATITRIDGEDFAQSIDMTVSGADGRELGRQRPFVKEGGDLTFSIPDDIGEPGEALTLSLISDSRSLGTATVVRDHAHLLARVETDKPLYRPGEPVRMRAVVLDRFRLTPSSGGHVNVRIEDPRGNQVYADSSPTALGVAAWNWQLPPGAVGGIYRVVASRPDSAFPEAEREITVRTYRIPRLKADLELDRESYSPGEAGQALVSVERAEGGFPVGATVHAILSVDGKPGPSATYAVDAAGGVTVPFTLPSEIERGRGQLALRILDGGVVENVTRTVPITLNKLLVDLYPEGGEAVAGLSGRVYFSVHDPKGEPAELVAELVDSEGTVWSTVRTETLGMGSFALTPRPGKRYSLRAVEPSGIAIEGGELAPQAHGVVLQTLSERVPAGAAVPLTVSATAGGDYEVSIWCRGTLIGRTTTSLAAGTPRRLDVSTPSDAGGVLRVTVLDPAGLPVAERLVYRMPSRAVNVKVSSDRDSVSPGERVTVSVLTTNEDGKPVSAVLGASVVDDSVLSLADDEDTPSLPLEFLLGMDVLELEKVELFTDGPEHARAVDLLLGVQGWRRFAWKTPEEFLAQHPLSGPRIVPVGKAEVSTLLFEDTARAESRVEAGRRDVDSRKLPAAGLLVLAILLGAGLALTLRRASSVAKIGLSAGSGLCFAFALLILLPGSGAGGSGPRLFAVSDRYELTGMSAPDAPMMLDEFRAKMEVLGAPPPPGMDAGPGDALGVPGAGAGEGGGGAGHPFQDAIGIGGVAGGGWREWRLEISDELPPPGFFKDWEDVVVVNGRLGRRAAELGGYFYAREYAHLRDTTLTASFERTDFTEVLYWNPLLATGEDGKAELAFDTSDSVTTFKIGLAAHDRRGALGVGEAVIENRLPFYLEPKLPPALSAGDRLRLPVVVRNATAEELAVTVGLELGGDLLTLEGEAKREVVVPANASLRVPFDLVAGHGRGEATISVTGTGGNLSDRVTRTLAVEPRGYPIAVDRSGVLEKADAAEVLLPAEVDRATLTGSLRLYPSVLATLVDGLDSMLRSPGGCFEQASSSNYPNVLILSYLQERGGAAPEVARRAKEYLARGYDLLTGYECGQKGYEWFGADPGHQALTAYGLMEFADMALVHDVDSEMVDRTRDWLLSARDGEGGFDAGLKKHLDTFGGAPREIEEAYIVWALSEAYPEQDLTKELALLAERARLANDPYLLALAALAHQNANPANHERFKLVIDLADHQEEDGSFTAKDTSVTSSRGENLTVETTALAALALLRGDDRAAGEKAIRYLVERRKNGGSFGATQATILALRALLEYGRVAGKMESDHELTIFVNGRPVANRLVPAGSEGVVVFDREVVDALVPGNNEIELRTTGAKALPWSLSLGYMSRVPAADPDCAVAVSTALAEEVVAEGGTVELKVTLTNREKNGIPMTLARVGLPGGLLPRPDQLKELTESGEIAFFETRPREVTLYLRGMAPEATKTITLDLIAEVPGTFEGPATSAYLYYTDDQKCWTEPLRIEVR